MTINNIVRCESDSNNTIFILDSGKKIFVTKTLKQFERLFEEHSFFRTHQSHLVNMDYIQEYIRKDGGYLKMKNGTTVPVAVRRRSDLLEQLNQL